MPSKTGRRYDMGLHQEGSTVLHVSRGLSGGHPVRYFCRPEATWLVLRSIKPNQPWIMVDKQFCCGAQDDYDFPNKLRKRIKKASTF